VKLKQKMSAKYLFQPLLIWSLLNKWYIISLEIDKSPGPDGWPTVVLKEISDGICTPLSTIFNMSIQSGTLPESWRVGHVMPIHKSGSQQNPSNFRPVSLTSVLGKVMDSLIYDVVLNHLLENNLMSPYQHGFLPQRSCSTPYYSYEPLDRVTSVRISD